MAAQTRQIPARPPVDTPKFCAGDIIIFASTGDVLTNIGRWLIQGKHESPTYAVHTAQFLGPRRVLEMEMLAQITTLDDVLYRRYWTGPGRSFFPPVHSRRPQAGRSRWEHLWQPRGFEVWRCTMLTAAECQALTHEALRYRNVRFGFVKLCAHALDNVICKMLRRDVFLFRHLDPEDRHPVCSGITAAVYDKALHYHFGVDPECADPDHIHDWLRAHPDEWVRVFRLDPLAQTHEEIIHENQYLSDGAGAAQQRASLA